jgi:hypothetical protein
VGFYEMDVDGEDVRGDVAVHRALMGLEDSGHSTQAALCHDAAAVQRFKVWYTVTMPKTTKPIPSELQRRLAFNVSHSLTSLRLTRKVGQVSIPAYSAAATEFPGKK